MKGVRVTVGVPVLVGVRVMVGTKVLVGVRVTVETDVLVGVGVTVAPEALGQPISFRIPNVTGPGLWFDWADPIE